MSDEPSDPPAHPIDQLERLAALAYRLDAEGIARDALALAARVRDGRFFVACLGQFKRGKSTLINALLGEALLPAGVAPVTSVVTVVRYGPRRARVQLGAGQWQEIPIEQVGDFVSEVANPENRKGVTGVEIFHPSPLLRHGLCLVDTPGIGSVFLGNTQETRAFVPHIDAALFVIGGDPPISGDEAALLAEVAKQVREVLLIFNKADRLTEQERGEARAFTESVVAARVPTASCQLFEVSALERMRNEGPERAWPELVARLDSLAQNAGAQFVEAARARGLGTLVARLRHLLAEERGALVRPIAESERRFGELRRCATAAEQSLVEISHLFAAEQERLAGQLDEERQRFVASAQPLLFNDLSQHLATATAHGSTYRQRVFETARKLAEDTVRAWMEQQQPVQAARFAAVTTRFVAHANAFLAQLRDSGQLPADALPPPLQPESGFRARSRFYFLSFMSRTTRPPGTWIADQFRAETTAQAAALRAGQEYALHLLEANAHRVVADFQDRVVESRRSVEAALRRTLREVATTAERALARAQAQRARGEAAVLAALADLDRHLLEIEEIERDGSIHAS